MEPIFKRDEKGKLLVYSSLELQCYIGALFDNCKTHLEIDWVHEVLEAYLEDAREGTIDQLEQKGIYREEDEEEVE